MLFDEPRNAAVIAVTALQVLSLDRAGLQRVLDTVPGLGWTLLTTVAERFNLRITRLHSHIGSGTDPEVWKMVAFVKKLVATRLDEKATGDPAAGRAIFRGKGGCTGCHSVGPEGASLGPDLSDVGRRRDLQYLEESLLRPDADVPIRYRAIRLTTKSGQTVAGIRLNEDDVSIQLRDEKDNLRSFLKDSIKELKV